MEVRQALRPESLEADLNFTRTFGGIERGVKSSLPTKREVDQLNSFCRSFTEHTKQRRRVLAFVNSRSGGQTGELLMRTLAANLGRSEAEEKPLIGEVCDLSKRGEPEATIERYARDLVRTLKSLPDGAPLPIETRLLVCGGDGTVTWILTALEQSRTLAGNWRHFPVAIVPLGTGNDLARSLGWGGRLKAVCDILQYLRWVLEAEPVTLDQWRIVLRPHNHVPETHKLRTCGSHPQPVKDEALKLQLLRDMEEVLPTTAICEEVFLGFWQNYYSVGVDAKVARHVDLARSHTSCGRCCFRLGCGKVCYAWQAMLHAFAGQILTRSLSILKVVVPGGPSAEELQPPLEERGAAGQIRQIMMVNINSYGAGIRVLPDVADAASPPSPADGVLEVMSVRNALSGLAMYAGINRPTYLASGEAVAFTLESGHAMQLDGEPWQLEGGCDILLEPHRKVTMLRAPTHALYWRGHIGPDFWCLVEEDDEQLPAPPVGGVPLAWMS